MQDGLRETGWRSSITSSMDSIVRREASNTVHNPEVRDDADFDPSRSFYLAILSLFVLALAAALGSTSLSIALPTIAAAINLSTTQAFWLGLSSSLASTVIQPSCACLADSLGRRGALAASVICLAAGSLAAALAHDFAVMILGRTLLGLGIGGILALTEIIVTDIVPLRFRGQYLAYVSIAWALGTVSGPLVGGALASGSSWRWIFGLNIPICAIALVSSLVSLPPLKTSRFSLFQKLCNIDWVGFTLFTGSLIGILIPIMQAQVVYPWNDYHTILPLCLSSVGMICFCLYEYFLATNPLIPFVIFKNWSSAITFVCTILHGLVLWCLLYYLPLYYEAVKGMTPIHAGFALLPETLSLVPASMAAGLAITWTGSYRWAIWTGWVVTTVGFGILMLLDANTSTASWIGLNLVVGAGAGMLFGSMAFAVQASVDVGAIAVAVCMFSFFRSFGSAIGITIGGTVFKNALRQQLEKYPEVGAAGVEDAIALVAAIKNTSESAGRSILVQACVKSLRTIWLDMCIVSAVGLLLSLLIKHYTLDVALPADGASGSEEASDQEKASGARTVRGKLPEFSVTASQNAFPRRNNPSSDSDTDT